MALFHLLEHCSSELRRRDHVALLLAAIQLSQQVEGLRPVATHLTALNGCAVADHVALEVALHGSEINDVFH